MSPVCSRQVARSSQSPVRLDRYVPFSGDHARHHVHVPEDEAVVRVARQQAWNAKSWTFDVALDGALVGRQRAGRSIDIPVAPGSHELTLKNVQSEGRDVA